LDRKVLQQYVSNTTWLVGLAADLGGAALMVGAISQAPVSVVQPVAGAGLLILAVFSHYYLEERLKRDEWAAIAVAGLGVVGVGLSAEDQDNGGLRTGRILAGFVVVIGALLSATYSFQRFRQRHIKFAAVPRKVPIGCGLLAGFNFGISTVACRTGFVLAGTTGRQSFFVPLGVLGSVVLSSGGMVWQTMGLKDGNSVLVCTMASVATMVVGMVAGIVALGERFPSRTGPLLVRLLSCAAIIVGSIALGQGGVRLMLDEVLGGGLVQKLRKHPLAVKLLPYLPDAAIQRLYKAKLIHADALPTTASPLKTGRDL